MERDDWRSRLRALIEWYFRPLRRQRLEVGIGIAVLLVGVAAMALGATTHHKQHVAALPGIDTPSPRAVATRWAPATVWPTPTATVTPLLWVPLQSPDPTSSGSIVETTTPTATARVASPPVLAEPTPQTLTPAGDPLYYAQDTLDGTGPGPAGPLSGLPTRPDLAGRRPVAVVIDNYAPDARPQTGLNRASLVFETLAEGGITRLMAVYLERDAPVVGPVRSARIYFNSWADGLRAIYGHAGGNSDALYQLGHGLNDLADTDDLNLPVAPGPSDQPYWRSSDRLMPHNLYTSTSVLRAYAHQAGDAIVGQYSAALPHRAPDQYQHRASTAWIDVPFSSPDYEVRYAYDRVGNRYLRRVGGAPQADPLSGRPVAPSNVVVLFTALTPDHDAFTPSGVDVHTVGQGRALYFRDGHLVQGHWRKRSIRAPLELLDGAGLPEAFNPGQTWIEVVPLGTPVAWHAA